MKNISKIAISSLLLSTGVSIFESNQANAVETKIVNVRDYGATPNDTTDDTVAINKALAEVKNGPVKLVFESGKYITSDTVQVDGASSLIIEGNGASLMYKHPRKAGTDWNEQYIMRVKGKSESVNLNVFNFTLDGSRDEQQLYNYAKKHNVPMSQVPITKGFYSENTANANFTNFKAQNFYGGRAMHFKLYNNVNINNSSVLNVGAKENENIGDALHFSSQQGNATINITGLTAKAKVSTENKDDAGWIGITHEGDTIQSKDPSYWKIDKNTTFNIKDSIIYNFDTGFHSETQAGNVYVNSDNLTYTGANWQIFAGIRGETKSLTTNSTINLLPRARNTYVHGVYHTQTMPNKYQLDMWNSTVNRVGDTTKRKLVTGVYGNGTVGSFYHTTFKGVPDMLGANAKIKLQNSAVNTSTDNTRATKESLMDNATYISTTGTTFKFKTSTLTIAPKGTAPASYKNTGYVAPPFTEAATPAI